jgi:hypothetical protein
MLPGASGPWGYQARNWRLQELLAQEIIVGVELTQFAVDVLFAAEALPELGVGAIRLGTKGFSAANPAATRALQNAGSQPAAEMLGDLTAAEVKAIQDVVDNAGRPLEVVGSAATATRRGVASGLPIGKGPGTASDIDYLAPPSSHPYFKGLECSLPSIDPETGIVPGLHNPHIGPAIRFEPGVPPFFVPRAP